MGDKSDSSDELPSAQPSSKPTIRGRGIAKKKITISQVESQVIPRTKRSYKKTNTKEQTEQKVPKRISPKKRTLKSGGVGGDDGGDDGGGPSGVDPRGGGGGDSQKIKVINKTIRGKEVKETIGDDTVDEPLPIANIKFVAETQDTSQNSDEEFNESYAQTLAMSKELENEEEEREDSETSEATPDLPELLRTK